MNINKIIKSIRDRKPGWTPSSKLVIISDGSELVTYLTNELKLLNIWYVVFNSNELNKLYNLYNYINSLTDDNITIFLDGLPNIDIALIKRLCEERNIVCRIYTYLYEGSYSTESRTAGYKQWIMSFEYAWITACEKVFVGSEYHKRCLLKWRQREPLEWNDKIVIVRTPYYHEYEAVERNIDIVWTHPFRRCKRPNLAVSTFKQVLDLKPNLRVGVAVTGQFFSNRPDYETDDPGSWDALLEDNRITIFKYSSTIEDVLKRSKIWLSTSVEENMDVNLVKAVSCGCFPMIPTGLCYDELCDAEDNPMRCGFSPNNNVAGYLVSALELINEERITGEQIRSSWSTLLHHCSHSAEYMIQEMFPTKFTSHTGD
jgi:hypothetical protein